MYRNLISTVLNFAMILVFTQSSYSQSSKSPGTATVLSVILPGAGHFYTGESEKGTVLVSAYTSALIAVIALGPWTWEDDIQGDPFFSDLAEGTGTPTSTKIIWYGSAAVAAGTFLYAVLDAGPSARRYNERYSFFPILKKDGAGVKIGVTMVF